MVLFGDNLFSYVTLAANLSSQEVVVSVTPVNPSFFLLAVFGYSFTNFWTAILLHASLVLLFDNFYFFLKDVNEDALDFDITTNGSVCASKLRNRSHFADPPPVLVFLSPSPPPSNSTTTVPYYSLL